MAGPLFLNVDCLALPVKDLEAALTFYRDKLGHVLIWRAKGAAGLRMRDGQSELVLRESADPPEADILVESAEQAASRFVDAGGSIVVAPFDIKIGKCVVVADPWGNKLVLLDSSKGLLKTDGDGWVVAEPEMIGFRPLQRDDLPLMCRWLNTDFVIEGYSKRPQSLDQITAKYIPRIDGTWPTRPFIILSGDRPIGYIQTFRFVDHPDYNRLVQAEADVAGIDLFIGESDCIHRGLGPVVLRQFLREVVFAQADITACVVGPAPANRTAIRANEKAGFRHWKDIQSPSGEIEHLMRIDRSFV